MLLLKSILPESKQPDFDRLIIEYLNNESVRAFLREFEKQYNPMFIPDLWDNLGETTKPIFFIIKTFPVCISVSPQNEVLALEPIRTHFLCHFVPKEKIRLTKLFIEAHPNLLEAFMGAYGEGKAN